MFFCAWPCCILINNNRNFQQMSTIDVGKDINLLRKFDLITLNIVLRKIHEITEPGCGFPFDCFVTSVLLPQKDFPQFSARPLTQVLQLWKLLSISTNGRPSLLRTLKPFTFTVQNSKGSCSQISTKEIVTTADEAEITASTNVLLIYMSKQRLFCRLVLTHETPECRNAGTPEY